MRSLLLALLIACSSAGPAAPHAQTAPAAAPTSVILVRHAERSPGDGDVAISAAGRERADALARLLRDTAIDTIITSHLLRTRETAAPVATQKGITPEVLPADQLDAVVERIRGLRGRVVLVVHHSNTVPSLVEKLGGQTPPIRDDEFDRLVVVTLPPQGAAAVLTLRYGPPAP